MAYRMYLSKRSENELTRVTYAGSIEGTVVQCLPGKDPPLIIVKWPGETEVVNGTRLYTPTSFEVFRVVGLPDDTRATDQHIVLLVESIVNFPQRNTENWDRVANIGWRRVEGS